MKLNAEINNQTHAVTLTREGSRVNAEIDGQRYELEARPAVNGEYLLLYEGRVFACLAQGAATNGATVTVSVGGPEYAVKLSDPKRLRVGAGAGLEKSGHVKAQMPGKVARVLVAAGDAVEEGAPLLDRKSVV